VCCNGVSYERVYYVIMLLFLGSAWALEQYWVHLVPHLEECLLGAPNMNCEFIFWGIPWFHRFLFELLPVETCLKGQSPYRVHLVPHFEESALAGSMNYISLVIWGGNSQNIFPIFICCRFELAMRGRVITWWWAASFSTRRWRWRCSHSSLPNADFGYFQPSVYCWRWSLWNEVGFRLLIILKQICFVMHFNFNTGLWSSWKLTLIWCIMYSISTLGCDQVESWHEFDA